MENNKTEINLMPYKIFITSCLSASLLVSATYAQESGQQKATGGEAQIQEVDVLCSKPICSMEPSNGYHKFAHSHHQFVWHLMLQVNQLIICTSILGE